ncbi:hypothetical protein BDK51DRAFT_26381, partial [Blyttiomyces helicus]
MAAAGASKKYSGLLKVAEAVPERLCAESVTKTLRAVTLPPQEKLAFARRIWTSKDLYVPAKDELLLDWLASALLKSIPKIPRASSTSLGEDPWLSLDHWGFFELLLTHFSAKRALSTAAGPLAPRAHSSAPTLKTPLVPIFSGLLGALARDPFTSSNTRKWVDLVRVASKCLVILLTDLTDVLRPSIENHMTLCGDALGALLRLLRAPGGNSEELSESLGTIAYRILRIYHTAMTMYPNQKKIFSFTVSKLVHPLLVLDPLVAAKAGSISTTVRADLQSITKDLLEHGLFHHEHDAEFVAVLQHVPQKAAAPGAAKAKDVILSYPHQLFDEIAKITKAGAPVEEVHLVAVSLPTLLEHFISARAKNTRATPASPTFSPEFAFYLRLHHIAEDYLNQLLTSPSPALKDFLRLAVDLLRILQIHDVYRATNDQVSIMQLEFLKALNRTFVDIAKAIPGHNWGAMAFHFVDKPPTETRDEAILLTRDLLKTFTRSRQLDILLESFLEAVRGSSVLVNADSSDFSTVLTDACLS